MPQEATAQEFSGGQIINGGNGGGSFLTGSTCTSSGTYTAENKYMRSVVVLAAGDIFPPFTDGKKIYWTALTQTVSGAKTADGGMTTVKVQAGTV